MKINAIGCWSLRIVLAIGAIVGGCLGKNDVLGYCMIGLIASFFFLDTDD